MSVKSENKQVFQDYIQSKLPLIETSLDGLVSEPAGKLYQSLFKAARYSLLAPGKRLRPILTLATVETLGGNQEAAIFPACTLEMVHTYSLIHDDLPSMDDDDLRRGRPTLHKIFPEGHSILTGNFLLTYAFEILSQQKRLSPELRLKLIETLSFHSGAGGLLGGQVIDLESEDKNISQKTLEEINCKRIH